MTSGSRPTTIIAPRRVQRSRPRREGGGGDASADIDRIIAAAQMQNAECRIRSGAILHSAFCILHSMLGIYIHLPFCRVHCAYCPFAISTNIGLQDDYTAALVREIEGRTLCAPTDAGMHASGRGAQRAPAAVDTIFFGGGTPSRTSRENLTRV